MGYFDRPRSIIKDWAKTWIGPVPWDNFSTWIVCLHSERLGLQEIKKRFVSGV